MAAFIKPIAYGTNVAFFRTADSHTYIVNDAYTFTLWPTPSPTPIHLFHLQPIIILLTIQITHNFIQLRLHFRPRHPAPVTIFLDKPLCCILRGPL